MPRSADSFGGQSRRWDLAETIDHAGLAARNNAVWCSIVAGTHGVVGTFEPDAWACPTRTPEFYPDAVTLRRGVDVGHLLGRIDVASGCSIKDSFADLDLTPAGFEPLFDASWIRRPTGPPSRSTSARRWRVVSDAVALGEWETAWLDGETGPRIFRPSLLGRDDVAILAIAAPDGATTTAILNVTDGVVGLSNVVTGTGDPIETLSVVLAAAARLFPGLDIVGYEQGALLDAARQVGFEVIGPLRVWMRP
jgi:hypothetical protein